MKNKFKYIIVPLTILSLILAYMPFPLGIFKVEEVSAAGWLAGWDNRIKFTIDNTKVDDDLTHFPVTVFLDSTQGEEVFTELTTDAEYLKVAFTEDNGVTELYAEKELFDINASQYPPAHSDTYVKSTSKATTAYWAYFSTDPALSLTGDFNNVQWLSDSAAANQRFHIDLGSAKVIKRIYYENSHHSGALTNAGAQNFTFWGSNIGAGTFDDLVYANNEGWTQITTAQGIFDQHTASDIADPKYITVTNTTAYRYYAFKFVDTWGNADYMGVRRIELQTEGEAIYHISKTGWEISSSTDTDFYMYYDNDHADNTTYIGAIGARTEVWDGNFKGVWHLEGSYNGTAGEIKDSTSNGHDGSACSSGQSPTQVDSKIGKGQSFDATVFDSIHIPDHADWDAGGAMTIESWIYPTDTINYCRAVGIPTFSTSYNWMIYLQEYADQGGARLYIVTASECSTTPFNSIPISDDTWYCLAGVYDKTLGSERLKLYNDGSKIGVADGYNEDITTSGEGIFFGAKYSRGCGIETGAEFNWYMGNADEIRFSIVARSAAWLKATYNSGNDSLLTYGSEEETPFPTVTTNAATNAEATTATLNGNVTSDGGNTITERGFYCDTNESPTTKYVVAGTTGEYTKDMTDLIPNVKYYFKAFATNSEGTSYGSILNFTTAVGVIYYAQRSTSANDDSSWQAETEIGRDSSGFGHMSLVPMDDEKVMALYNDYDGSNYNLKYRIYDSSWGASSTTVTDCKDNTNQADWDEYHWFSAVADSSNNIHVIYVDSGDNDLNYIYYDGSSWSSAQEIYTGTVTHPSLSYDSTTGNLVAFFIEGNAVKYKVKKSGSWGDPSGGAVVKTGLDSPTYLGSAYSDATSIGIIWRETSSSPYAISYAILTLSEARSDIIRIKGGVRLKGGLRLK